jgi:hypothetical protein
MEVVHTLMHSEDWKDIVEQYVCAYQGDRIGRIFTYWAKIVHFGQFF